ncbi:MAG: response regulator transcription factor [Dehalococcoidales bacterium]|nr:response regulator transcription factor [Dehalococcoidales bacterium]
MKKIKVMIADDHRLFSEGLRQLINTEPDLECIAVARDGEEAVEMAQSFNPDVLLLDISMPRKNGIEAAKEISKMSPNIAILILTAYKNDQYVFSSIDSGVSGYLLKDSDPADLLNSIRLLYSGEAVFNLELARKYVHRVTSNEQGRLEGNNDLHIRELEILNLVAKGMTNKEISKKLFISEHTVSGHLVNIFRKLGVSSRTEATLHAIKKGMVTVDESSTTS